MIYRQAWACFIAILIIPSSLGFPYVLNQDLVVRTLGLDQGYDGLISARTLPSEPIGEIEEKFCQIYNAKTESTKQLDDEYMKLYKGAFQKCSWGTLEHARSALGLAKIQLKLWEQIQKELEDLLHRSEPFEVWRWGNPILDTVSSQIRHARQKVGMLQKTLERRNFSATKFGQTIYKTTAKEGKLRKQENERFEEILKASPPPPRLISEMLEQRISANAGCIEYVKKDKDSVTKSLDFTKKYWKPMIGAGILGACTIGNFVYSGVTARQQLQATKVANDNAAMMNKYQLANLMHNGVLSADGKMVQVPGSTPIPFGSLGLPVPTSDKQRNSRKLLQNQKPAKQKTNRPPLPNNRKWKKWKK